MLTIHKPKNTKRNKSLFIGLLCASFLLNVPAFSQTENESTSSAFQAHLMNIEAASNEPFRYNATLRNTTGKTTTYDFQAELPPGWLISYRVDGSQVTSVQLEAGSSKDVHIEINASLTADPKKYKIPIVAKSGELHFPLHLEAVVKGSYDLSLSTPTGRLSDEVLSGSSKEITLVVKNTGTLPLNKLDFSSQLPSRWEANFEPSTIEQLEPGKTIDIKTKLSVPDKTIAGDYVAKFTVKNDNKQSEASFRIIVKTSILSGWIGIGIILLAVGLIYFLIRKYGRR
ncbi:NEW3 domain-containing protein [Sphingobacterium sp. UT-1RO-CII-1]|uniref:COG1470 family protein n=1 Tax=Sphingobacterium sp. UT-1RO-CII-1 TaxID=2995225 RepID=UPI00227AF8D5|nr:NEW3 domain-containing protein [Sphingobacterium sp. UT-1RO-CII-1]MCY4781722.1 NEW3 domain-containing protein [Sphingobacterium sp. UT-1RO-CII-1]